jgi:hypothetical protein
VVVLHRFATKFEKLVVLVDQNPASYLRIPPNVVYVSVNDERSGQMAGALPASLVCQSGGRSMYQ